MNCGILRLFEALAKATLVALASIAALSQNVAAQAQSASPSLPGEVIAILDKNSPAQARRVEAFIDLAAQRGFALRYRHQLSGLKLEMITLALAKGVSGAEAIEILEGAAPYSVVGVNHFYELAEAPVPRLFARKAIRWPG